MNINQLKQHHLDATDGEVIRDEDIEKHVKITLTAVWNALSWCRNAGDEDIIKEMKEIREQLNQL